VRAFGHERDKSILVKLALPPSALASAVAPASPIMASDGATNVMPHGNRTRSLSRGPHQRDSESRWTPAPWRSPPRRHRQSNYLLSPGSIQIRGRCHRTMKSKRTNQTHFLMHEQTPKRAVKRTQSTADYDSHRERSHVRSRSVTAVFLRSASASATAPPDPNRFSGVPPA
jgi:hypothetical protein